MKSEYLGYALGITLGIGVAFAPESGKAFYVSQKEMQKAGIKSSQFMKDSMPMGDTFSYKGHLEDDETFNIIAKRIQNGAEKSFRTELSDETSWEAIANFNSYMRTEMPSVTVPCKYQFMSNYVRALEKRIKQHGKSEPLKKELEFIRGKLQEVEKLYEQDISELKEKYMEHEKRIEELEGRPEQKDYSKEIEELRGDNRELRKMIEGMEKEYSQTGQEYSKPGNAPPEYIQPVQPPAGSNVSVIVGLPEWLPGIPYTYSILDGSIYCWSGLGWTYWGILEPYGFGFRGRRWDGRFFDYYGPRDFPYYGHHKPYRGFPDAKRWGARGKDFDVHTDPRHGRGERRPDFHDRRFEVNPRNLPGRHFEQGRREFRPQAPPSNFPRGHPNNQFNRQFNQSRGGFRGPQAPPHGGSGFRGGGSNAPQRGFGNPGGRGMQSRPQSRGGR